MLLYKKYFEILRTNDSNRTITDNVTIKNGR